MIAQSLLDSVFALPVEDRLDLFRRLQNDLGPEADDGALNESHRMILEERLADLERNPDSGLAWEEVERHVLDALRKP